MKIIEVRINCPTLEVAEQLAAALLENKLAASTNIYSQLQSRYWWKGKLESHAETALIAKTRASLFDAIEQLVKDIHPYQIPSIQGSEIEYLSQTYKDWILQATREAKGA